MFLLTLLLKLEDFLLNFFILKEGLRRSHNYPTSGIKARMKTTKIPLHHIDKKMHLHCDKS